MKIKTILLATVIALLSACSDPCKDVTCQNDGTCDDGKCICVDGYEGDRCEAEIRAKFYGTYSGTLTCTQEYDGYTYEEDTELMLTVEAGPDLNQVIITDGYDPITATFNSMNEYTATDGETTITGTLSESTLTVAFMIDYGDYSTECSGELTK